MKIDEKDASTILAYKKGVEKKRGYNGPCFISTTRLVEIHMPMAYVITLSALNKMKG